jgi:hypothetical protein
MAQWFDGVGYLFCVQCLKTDVGGLVTPEFLSLAEASKIWLILGGLPDKDSLYRVFFST